MVLIAGVDEAGRGPVIGPLVIVGAMLDEKDLPKLDKLGVKDSKLLTPKKREELFPKIQQICKYKIIIIEPKEIDEAVLSEELNLNWLEALKSVEIIKALKPNKAILDCPSPNIPKYTNYIKEKLGMHEIKIICEHKADVNHKIVGAASILAKVTRDRIIEEIRKKYGEIGPGYTSNAITQKFLKENWDKHPEIFRKSWISWQNHKNGKDQKKLGEF
ncbi:ribonuclease HII [Candidatus Woesearchaeota archaeon]|nr:ribonuclease HII [Candidatus Woesearchaeota archaeon]